MPFQSEKQRRYLHANHPEIAKRWERDYGEGGIAALNAQLNQLPEYYLPAADGGQLVKPGPGRPGYNGGDPVGGYGPGGSWNGGGGDPPPTPEGDGPPSILNPLRGPTATEIATDKEEAELVAREMALQRQHKKKKVKHLETISSDQPIGFVENLENLYGKENIQLAKVYNKKALENIGADWAGYGFGANDKLEAMQNLYEGVKKLQNTTLGATLTLQEAKEEVIERGNQLGTGYKKVDADLVPKDFLETEVDVKTQTSPYKLFDKAKGGLARKNYFHGGILDINESEEIISDDGNDIELTAYNAAFDDPNDLSTGVKSLFRAKEGGTPQLAKKSSDGKRPGYGGPHETYGGGVEAGRDRGPVSEVGGDASVAEQIAADDRKRQQDLKDIIERGPGSDVEKYDTEEQMLQDKYAFNPTGAIKKNNYIIGKKKSAYEQALAKQKAKMKKMGLGKLLIGLVMLVAQVPPNVIMDTLMLTQKDMQKVIMNAIPVMTAKKGYMTALGNAKADYKELGMADFHHAVDTEIQTIDQKLLDLTKSRDEDDLGPHDPVLPKVIPIEEEIKEYEDVYALTPWERIKANQAKRAMLVEKDIIQDSLIVDESVADITMQANRGGLANLFRVKNQY